MFAKLRHSCTAGGEIRNFIHSCKMVQLCLSCHSKTPQTVWLKLQTVISQFWTVTDFIFLGSKITADGDCSHEIKRCLLLEETMTNLDSILKSRDITLPTKVRLVKAMVFPVVMYGCVSWTIKKAECQKLLLLNCGVEEDS